MLVVLLVGSSFMWHALWQIFDPGIELKTLCDRHRLHWYKCQVLFLQILIPNMCTSTSGALRKGHWLVQAKNAIIFILTTPLTRWLSVNILITAPWLLLKLYQPGVLEMAGEVFIYQYCYCSSCTFHLINRVWFHGGAINRCFFEMIQNPLNSNATPNNANGFLFHLTSYYSVK